MRNDSVPHEASAIYCMRKLLKSLSMNNGSFYAITTESRYGKIVNVHELWCANQLRLFDCSCRYRCILHFLTCMAQWCFANKRIHGTFDQTTVIIPMQCFKRLWLKSSKKRHHSNYYLILQLLFNCQSLCNSTSSSRYQNSIKSMQLHIIQQFSLISGLGRDFFSPFLDTTPRSLGRPCHWTQPMTARN
jgi:hypothetical protein